MSVHECTRKKKCVSTLKAGARLVFRVQTLARTKQKVFVSPQGWCTFHFASAKLLKKIETTANRLFLVIFSSENPLFLEIG